MNNKGQDEALLERVGKALDSQAEQLDPVVLTRLRRARVAAMNSYRQERPAGWRVSFSRLFGFSRPVWQGFAVAALATVLVSAFVLQGKFVSTGHLAVDSSVQGEESVVNVMDMLMSNEDMELLENLELYEWLDAEYG